jgi:putative inorganic carbon (HCO3(-)) transporter
VGALGLLFCVLVVLIQRFDAPVVLLAVVALAAAASLVLRPELATLLTVFLLYTNIPAILTKRHGVPVAAAGAFILLLGLPLLHAIIIRREPLRFDTTLRLMLAYLAVVLCSALVATDPGITFDYAQKFAAEGLLLYLLVVNVVRSAATLRRVIWTALAAGSLLGAVTTYQEVTGHFRQEFGGLAARNYEFMELRQRDPTDPEVRELMQSYTERYGTSGRAPRANGPLDEPNRFGQIMIVLLPLALFCYRTGRNAWSRAGAMAAAALISSAIVYSESRGAFVTLVILALLAGMIRWVRPAYVLTAALIGLLLAPLVAPKYVERLASLAGVTTLAEGAASAEADGALKGRAAAMTSAARVFLDHPMLGVGAGQFQPFYSVEYQQNDPRFRFREPRPYMAHSLYLQLGAELGVVGLVAFLSIFGFQLRELDRARRRWSETRPEVAQLATAVAFSILAYLGAAVFLHMGFERYLWLVVALAGSTLQIVQDATRAEAR